MIELVIFDLDGTLVDTFDANFTAYEKACNLKGFTITREQYSKVYGLSWKDAIPRLTNITDMNIAKEVHELKNKYYPHCLALVKPISNTINLKNLLKSKYRLCIGTSASRENVEAVLKATKLEEDFEFVVASEDVQRGKPEPDIFLRCAELAKVMPQDCFVIEDSEAGIMAAKNAGMSYFKI